MSSPGDRDLDRALADLAEHLAYPSTPDIASRVRRSLATQPARPFAGFAGIWNAWRPVYRGLAVVAVLLVVVAAATLAASPEARTAIADRLGLRGVQIQQVPALPSPTGTAAIPTLPAFASPAAASSPGPGPTPTAAAAGSQLNLGQPMTLEQARARVAHRVLVPGALGDPDEVYVQDVPVGGQVALVYHPRPDLPQARATGVGLLLTQFQGTVSTAALGKLLPAGTRLEEVRVNTGRGYWIDGDPHSFFVVDSRGQFQPETTRLAGSVLLWEHGALTLRLESALGKDAALQIAASAQ